MIRNAKGKVITIGEVYLEATSPKLLKLKQSSSLDFCFRGVEMNVAASLSSMGQEVSHFTVLPNDILGDAAANVIKQRGIDTQLIERGKDSLNICFVEPGNGLRPCRTANVNHDSSETIEIKKTHWTHFLEQSSWLFWSINLAGWDNIMFDFFKVFEMAKDKDVMVCSDLSLRNSERKLKYSKKRATSFLSFTSVVIANTEDINFILGSKFGDTKEGFIAACEALNAFYPNVTKIFDKVISGASCYGRGWAGKKYIETLTIEIGNIVDANGANESFTAGLLYILRFHEDIHALNFAIASYALQHTVIGEYSTATITEIIDTLTLSLQQEQT